MRISYVGVDISSTEHGAGKADDGRADVSFQATDHHQPSRVTACREIQAREPVQIARRKMVEPARVAEKGSGHPSAVPMVQFRHFFTVTRRGRLLAGA